MAMIEIRDLVRRYGNVTAVAGISLDVEQGEMLVLLGGSGSGKTTTLKMINRLVEPTSGSVHIGGEDAAGLDPHVLRRRIGYVFQQIGLFPHMSVGRNVGLTLELLGWARERIERRVGELLELVELDPGVRDRQPAELSGGQQQRVGVARALAAEPRLMLLDEPFGGLDPLTRDRLQTSLVQIKLRLGLTAVFVTHDMVEALLLADRIAVMRDGLLVQVGTPAHLLSHPADDYVAQLVSTPRRQAETVDRLLADPSA